MKLLATILSALLGVLFALGAFMFLIGKIPQPPLPPGRVSEFMGVMGPSGYMHFVKAFELLGGILLAIPKTRNWGLIVLWPIAANILAFDLLIDKEPKDLVPVLIVLPILAFVTLTERAKFLALLR